MSSPAILDFGTARTKILVALAGPADDPFRSASVETRFGTLIDRSRAGIDAAQLIDMLAAVEKAARELGADRFFCVGTEAFRAASGMDQIAREINRRFGNFTILDVQSEARYFYEGVSRLESLNSFVAADIGGGTVQIVWGIHPPDFVSLPVGTYRLEQACQSVPGVFVPHDSRDAANMRQRLIAELQPVLPRLAGIPHQTLVIGSNVMRDFFAMALKAANIAHVAGRLHREDVDRLYNMMSGRPYPTLAEFYPANPGFMFGVDKLLLIIATLMDQLQRQEATVTNASVSKGLALMHLSP